ncbi:MarR family transcriptional regulator [uncultured Nocardioides sp.]|jgi:DNA-binding MarR family transcriptional regulator|uniref:MarR family winged helix-turn-helix transcriptional regulator n=1 Tax=Nocardioides sp. TaxID=35761 RepID=UPI00261C099C|nr:MarR family transcriptional regulator [uncultured Nocardioides sp.]MCK5927101.1 MarR family transcriptional regulator [Nocardioides sp.]
MTDDVPWLSAEERGAWTALAAVVIKLPGVLDAQLQRDAQLSFFEYMIMAVLSEKEGRSDQMSEIAAATNASLSRLSHAVSRLERAGWIERERLPGAGRRTRAILTDAGYDAVVAAAPGHVRRVRELVVDVVDPDGLAALRQVCEQVLAQIDPERGC